MPGTEREMQTMKRIQKSTPNMKGDLTRIYMQEEICMRGMDRLSATF
jgi:hypothetical protein